MVKLKIIKAHDSGLAEGKILNVPAWVANDLIKMGHAEVLDQDSTEEPLYPIPEEQPEPEEQLTIDTTEEKSEYVVDEKPKRGRKK